MFYETYLPCEPLRVYIQSFAISESDAESSYKVLPGTGLVIGFQYKGRVTRVEEGNENKLSRAGLTGLHDQFKVFKSEANTGTVLVYFKEGAASFFFKQPIHELFNESVSLDNFMLRSELLLLEEKICEASSNADRIKVVEEFLLSRLNPAAQDNLVLSALALIHKTKGTIRIKEMLTQLHTSQSPLEKRFRQVVGTTPKKFAAIVRMKHSILHYRKGDSLTNLSYEAGFYDQAHFIKAFKDFAGETPESFFGKQ